VSKLISFSCHIVFSIINGLKVILDVSLKVIL